MRFESVARTHIGCRRKTNEDAMLVRADLGVWAVADGMGGHEAGDVASALVVERLGRGAHGNSPADRAEIARAALVEANRQLWNMTAGGTPRTIGSTVVAVAVDANRFT